MAAGVFIHGGAQVGIFKVWPEFRTDNDFCVGDLPEEEVGNTEFTRGADEEVGIGDVLGV